MENCAGFIKSVSLMIGALALVSMNASAASAQSAANIYTQQCQACHGTKGQGDGPAAKALKPPPSDFAKSLGGKSDAWIAKAITDGGAAVGESAVMPPFKSLSAEQVTALVAYIKQFSAK